MTFLTPWLAAAAFTAGSATFVPPAVPSVDHSSSSTSVPQSSSSSSSSASGRGSAQPHHVGVGATFGLGFKGGGVAVRYFFSQLVGLDMRAVLASRPNDTGQSQGMSIQVAPSIIVMLKKPDGRASIDVRPYIGGGASYTHARPDTQLGFPSANGLGEQVFGGVELQFRSADSFAVCGEVIYFRTAAALAGTTAPSGTTFVIAALLYK